MKRDEREFVVPENLVQLLFSVVTVAGKAMSKHGDKKTHAVVNVTSEVTMTLEKSLVLLLDHITQGLSNLSLLSQKEAQTFRREISTETVSTL